MPHIGVFDWPTYYQRGALDDDADYVIYGARFYRKHLPSASYWMVPGTYFEGKSNARILDGARTIRRRNAEVEAVAR